MFSLWEGIPPRVRMPRVRMFGTITSTTVGSGVAHMFGGRVAEPNSGMMISLQGSSWVNWLCTGKSAVDMANECKRLIEKEGKFFDV